MTNQLLDVQWAKELCSACCSTFPDALLEELMEAPECNTFGPIHHYLVGAALLTCAHNKGFDLDLATALDELQKQASQVPGAACARWGVCGAAVSCGIALSIALNNAPLKAQGWSEVQLMVSDILNAIATSGAPRCCKRDSRIALQKAIPWFNRLLSIELSTSSDIPRCSITEKNTVCIADSCPYFNRNATSLEL